MTDRPITRRTFARLTAGMAAAGAAGCFHEEDPEPGAPANGDIDPDDDQPEDDAPEDDEDGEEPLDTSKWQDVEEIRLEADADGWIGLEPEPIAEQENPVLVLFHGREYTITIENGDGQQHNLRIENAAGDVIEDYESSDVEDEGAEASVEIEATNEMVVYVCEYHEESMAGEIRTEEERDFEDPEEDAVPEDQEDGGNFTDEEDAEDEDS